MRTANVTRATYAVVFFITSFLAWLLSHWAEKMTKWTTLISSTPSALYGTSAVYRVIFGLATFHFGQAVLFVGLRDTSDSRAGLQLGWWCVKLPLLAALCVMYFFLPSNAIVALSIIALIGAAVFVLMQLVLLVNFAHSWTESWIDKWDEGANGNGWYYGLIGASMLLYSVALTLTVVAYKLFAPSSSCSLNLFFITFNLIVTLVASGLAVSPAVQEANPRSGLLQAACVTAYASYLVLSALVASNDHSSCARIHTNSSGTSHPTQIAVFIVGAGFTVISVCYSALRISTHDDELTSVSTNRITAADGDEESAALVGSRRGGESLGYNVSFFHLCMAMAAMYVGMLLTNWKVISESDSDDLYVNSGKVSMWVQITSSWVALLLYVWSILAPVMFPDRDFS